MEDLADWLSRLGLGRFAPLLAENEVGLDILLDLSEQDLEQLGIPFGPRKKLLKVISEYKEAGLGEKEGGVAVRPSVLPIPSISGGPEGERRQLTVLFCDLVGFTELASRVDPEVLQGIIRTYEDACAVCITRYDGYVFQRLGDGIVAFFGFPLAHEGEAERAIHAGLSIIEALAKLDVPEAGRLRVRIGIATGLVVVSSAEKGAVGETMNLASRLQGIAPVGGIVVSERVRQLAGGRFLYENLGEQSLKGIARPTSAYRVVGVSQIASRFEAATQEGLTPMVGREQEIGLLLDKWHQVREGEGQAVLLSGEPGIGKSRILSALRERLEAQGAGTLRFQCSPYHVNSAFYPSIDNLERVLKFARDETPQSKLGKLEALVVTHYGRPKADVRFLAAMLSIPAEERYAPLTMTPQRFKDETLRALVDLTEAAARKHPNVMLFEDAHWADPTSLEVLDLLIDRVKSFPLLIVMTHRPEFHNRWGSHGHVAAINLSKLTKAQSSAIVAKLAKGKTLPGNLLEQILAKTDGVPLFVEELTKAILEFKDIAEKEDRYEYTGDPAKLTIPATLRDSLMARLDRNQAVKEIAQIGAAIGREFSYELIEAVAPKTQTQLGEALQRLTESGLAFRRGTPPQATYTFKHALVQDVAYDSLLKSRRQELHARIGHAIKEKFPEIADAEPDLLAYHLTSAGLAEEAVPLWHKAGEIALKRMALADAIKHLGTGLNLVSSLPKSRERNKTEIGLRSALATAWTALAGWAIPEIERTLAPALELADPLGDSEQLAPILYGLWLYYACISDFRKALDLSNRMLAINESQPDSVITICGRLAAGLTHYWMGNFREADEHLYGLMASYDVAKHGQIAQWANHDPKCAALAWASHRLWIRGYPDKAAKASDEQLQLARELGYLFNLGFSFTTGSVAYILRGDSQVVYRRIQEAVRFGRERGSPVIEAFLAPFWGSEASLEAGDPETAYADIRRAMDLWRHSNGLMTLPRGLAIESQALHQLGRYSEALSKIDEALALTERTAERWHEAEGYRIKGCILLTPEYADEQAAEVCFRKSLSVAVSQEAKSWELRTSTSLARLWQSQGKRKEAYDLLAPIYHWFTEGFGTKDLKEAKALLAELS